MSASSRASLVAAVRSQVDTLHAERSSLHLRCSHAVARAVDLRRPVQLAALAHFGTFVACPRSAVRASDSCCKPIRARIIMTQFELDTPRVKEFVLRNQSSELSSFRRRTDTPRAPNRTKPVAKALKPKRTGCLRRAHRRTGRLHWKSGTTTPGAASGSALGVGLSSCSVL